MHKSEVHSADYLDAVRLAGALRREDREEIEATSEWPALQMILFCLRRSRFAYAVYVGEEILCMGGVIDEGKGVGRGWLLSADALDRHWIEFSKRSKQFFRHIVSDFSVIYNFVDVRYLKSIGWLQWLGFEAGAVYEMAPSRAHFVKMTYRGA